MKKILACDGGGIGALFSLQVLGRIEALYREAHGRPDLVLREVFDLFAGTSTGAIVAAGLAWGMTVGQIEQLYLNHSEQIFTRAPWYRRLRGKYQMEPVARLFREHFCEDDGSPALLGTRRLWEQDTPKFLLIVMRNATTGSPWPVSNNPRARFNAADAPDCNLRIPIWKLLRASTAAPIYFPPEDITLGAQTHVLVDGGITPYNNPALIALLTATLPAYRIEWPTGVDELLLVSIGTGFERTTFKNRRAAEIRVWDQALYLPPALLGSIAVEQDVICRIMGECRFGADIDSELEKLTGRGLFPVSEKKFSYVRYNRFFATEEALQMSRDTGQDFTLDNVGLIPHLREKGQEYAEAAVRPSDLGL
jgi:hypothetical protein